MNCEDCGKPLRYIANDDWPHSAIKGWYAPHNHERTNSNGKSDLRCDSCGRPPPTGIISVPGGFEDDTCGWCHHQGRYRKIPTKKQERFG